MDIAGINFTVKEIEKPDWIEGRFMGMMNFEEKGIYINKDMCEEQKESTKLHEYIHAVLDSYGFPDESENEALVSMLQNELYRAGFRIPYTE